MNCLRKKFIVEYNKISVLVNSETKIDELAIRDLMSHYIVCEYNFQKYDFVISIEEKNVSEQIDYK